MRVLVAMSGGVDSSVAAARAVEAGHDVVGVHLALHKDAQQTREKARGCCSLEDSADARRICDKLGIPFYVWDFSEQFKEEVIGDFVDSYARGETPNPCLRCNEKIKFRALLQKGMALGFDAVATGHYATLDDAGYMRRSKDENKDQSYVLGVISAEELEHCYFPIGDTPKPQIREESPADAQTRPSRCRAGCAWLPQYPSGRRRLGHRGRCPSRAHGNRWRYPGPEQRRVLRKPSAPSTTS